MTMRFWTRTVAVTAASLLALTGCATGGEEAATSSSQSGCHDISWRTCSRKPAESAK